MHATKIVTSFIKDNKKILILKRSKKVKSMKGLWSGISGIIEKDEIPLERAKIEIFEVDLLDLEKNISIIDKLTDNIRGLIWISGSTGNPDEEYLDLKKCETNIRINFLNPVLLINKIAPKMIIGKKSFIAVLTSVAGLRGRSKRLFYSSAKSGLINYLSGLRQKLNKEKINVITVIPGYMKTKPFNIKAQSFLITSPEKSARIIYDAIKKMLDSS